MTNLSGLDCFFNGVTNYLGVPPHVQMFKHVRRTKKHGRRVGLVLAGTFRKCMSRPLYIKIFSEK